MCLVITSYSISLGENDINMSFTFGAAIEFSKMLSFFAIVTNLITYLTKSLHQDIATAAKNVNYWSGVTTLIRLIGSYLAAPTQAASQWSCLLPHLFHGKLISQRCLQNNS